MYELFTVVLNDKGLHARPSKAIAVKVRDFQSTITIRREGCEILADASSVLAILCLAVRLGECLIVRAEGPDEKTAATEVAEFIKTLRF